MHQMAGWWIYLTSLFFIGIFSQIILSNIKFTLEANSSSCLDVVEYAKKQWSHEQTNINEKYKWSLSPANEVAGR